LDASGIEMRQKSDGSVANAAAMPAHYPEGMPTTFHL
jgi:hypothetical protein